MDTDQLCVNTLRFLSVDAIEQAKSGHPGLPLGAAPMAYVLWDRFLRFDPQDPAWLDRDRFVLSAGHGSALLYSLLHMYGYGLPLDELKRFRQWGSRTPGHPEHGRTPGVEATTGPLGQGLAMSVGMAIAERFLEDTFNLPDLKVVGHRIFTLVSDGDLMEGISYEAASLAGLMKLDNLICLYDDNEVSLEGPTAKAFTEDVKGRFVSMGWSVLRVEDGNDLAEIDRAIRSALSKRGMPTLVMVRTHIGYGSPKQGTHLAHGEPLGKDAALSTKKALGWPLEPAFHVPPEALDHCRKAVGKGAGLSKEWQARLAKYREKVPELAARFDEFLGGTLPDGWKGALPTFSHTEPPIATREASAKVMNALNQALHAMGPYHILVGGSADLNPSTKTFLTGFGEFGFDREYPHNIHFGVREHAMGAIANGLALHSRFRPYTATFLVFSDYMREPIRLAAIMQTRVIFIFTHDSIMVGEDGPTHEPVEQVMSLRMIPGLTVLRPADANETVEAWKTAVDRKGPVALILTRQAVPTLDSVECRIPDGFALGAYIIAEANDAKPDIVLVGTGSEVHLVLAAKEELEKKGISARVVSMPSWELFEEQGEQYKRSVFPRGVPVLAVEAGVTAGWHKYVGDKGAVLGLDRFGESAPGKTVYEKLGFSVENVVRRAVQLLGR